MSRAFIKEDAGDASDDMPERPLPPGPNYVTPRGLRQLEERVAALGKELAALGAEDPRRTFTERVLRYYRARLESAILVRPGGEPDRIRFGAEIEVRDAAGALRRFSIVGEDEAETGEDLVSWKSPLAAAVLGAGRGDRVVWSRPAGEEPLEIVSVGYPNC